MINLKYNEIIFEDKAYPILKWVVWFMTPVGLFMAHDEALKHVDDERLVVPVPVARGSGDIYEVATRM